MTTAEYESSMRMLQTISDALKHYKEQARKATSALVVIRSDIDRALATRRLWQACKLFYRLFWAKREQNQRNAEFTAAIEFAERYYKGMREYVGHAVETSKITK